MSRIVISLLLLFVVFLTPEVQAQVISDCPNPMVKTVPATLFSDPAKVPMADFLVNVGNNKDYNNWKMQFECGAILHQVKDATPMSNGYDIAIQQVANNQPGCEFFAGNHTIIVKTGDTPLCRVYYSVVDSDTQCQLEIFPDKDIISGKTDVTVKGKNLSAGGTFGLFVDGTIINNGKPIDSTNRQFPANASDPGISIPSNLLTLGSHQVVLHKYQFTFIFGSFKKDVFGSPLCSTTFTVGTSSNPGAWIKPSPEATGSASLQGPPTTSSGKETPGCTNDPKNPGIATAIGCIHTNPAALVKDLMRFILGIGGGIAFLMMLLGAFQMLTSAGNPETLNAGRERLTSAIIGLLMVIFAVLLLQIIGIGILNLPGFK